MVCIVSSQIKLYIMNTNKLYYTTSKIYVQAGTTFKINVEILLADGNWSIMSLFTRNARRYTQSKTGFTILRTVVKKLQSTICVSRKRNMTRFTRHKINNILNTSYFRLVSLNVGKENLMRL